MSEVKKTNNKDNVKNNQGINFFEKYLSLWVLICMIVGILISVYLDFIPEFLGSLEYANVSLPTAILIWIMILPMMMKIDFTSVKEVKREPRGLFLTWIVNWLIQPFTMFAFAWFFFFIVFQGILSPAEQESFLAGAVLLGAAPCTAMVFVWSKLTKGDPAYTVIQVSTNDLIILVLFAPTVSLLLGVAGIKVPYATLFLSVLLYVVIPLVLGILIRTLVIKKKGEEWFNEKFITKFDISTMIGLLLMLVMIFSLQGSAIIENPLYILLIAVPLTLQTLFIFTITYFTAYKMKLPHKIAAPSSLIGASNFFELSVAVAVGMFGLDSPVVLVTTVGVLIEVPLMLMLVSVVNRTRKYFDEEKIDE